MVKRKLISIAIAAVLVVFSVNGFGQPKSKTAKAKTTNTASTRVKKTSRCHYPMCGGVVHQTNLPTTSGLVRNESIKERRLR